MLDAHGRRNPPGFQVDHCDSGIGPIHGVEQMAGAVSRQLAGDSSAASRGRSS